MVGATGLEPAASWSQTKHSTKLSYAPVLVLMTAQLLYHKLVGLSSTFFFERNEPQIPRSAALLFGAPGGIRTRDLLIRSQTLYPTELRAHFVVSRDNVYDYITAFSICQQFFEK